MPERRSIFLYPLSLIYGLITSARNFLYNTGALKSYEFSIPIICIGNLTVGGTGKTPHTEYLADLLNKNFKVAVLSRGYKRNTTGFHIADPASSANDIGDEPMQIHRKFTEIIVAVDRDRVHGVRKILEEKPETGVILLDDGFQHRRIIPGLSVLLTDFERLMIYDALLPYGNLRESLSNIRRADIILITKSPEDISPIQRRIIVKEISKAPYQNLYFTSLTYKDPLPVFEKPDQELNLNSQNEDGGIVLVTGIANPKPLSEFLQNKFSEIIHLSFGDHYHFTEKDIEKITGTWHSLKSARKYIITTEKDAARLREFTNIAEPVRSAFFYIPLGINFLNNDKDEFDNLIVDYVRKNKRNNRIS